jgi:ATP-dependent HslUV protease, peptidase subunit HslV
MTIIAAAIKDGKVSISSDTQSNFGSLKVHAEYMNDHDKLFRVNDSVIGVTGWTATTQIIEHIAETAPEIFTLNSRWEIFEMLLGLQRKLKEDYYIETNENSDQPVESNQLDALIISPKGIFSIGSYREVHKYDKFWSLGSGKRYALGAMHSIYESNATAKEISEAGVKAATEFDDGCNVPIKTMVLDLELN